MKATIDRLKLICGAFDPDVVDFKEIHNDYDGIHNFMFENDHGKFEVTISTYSHGEEWGTDYGLSDCEVWTACWYDCDREIHMLHGNDLKIMTGIIFKNLI